MSFTETSHSVKISLNDVLRARARACVCVCVLGVDFFLMMNDEYLCDVCGEWSNVSQKDFPLGSVIGYISPSD